MVEHDRSDIWVHLGILRAADFSHCLLNLVSRDLKLTSSLQSLPPLPQPLFNGLSHSHSRTKHTFPLIPALLLDNPMDHLIDNLSIRKSLSDPREWFSVIQVGLFTYLCTKETVFHSMKIFHVLACSNIRRERERKIPVECGDKATIKCSNKKIKSNITNTVECGETLLRLIEA